MSLPLVSAAMLEGGGNYPDIEGKRNVSYDGCAERTASGRRKKRDEEEEQNRRKESVV